MSENLFPRRDPAAIAAELFRSCQWEEAGHPFGSAHKAAYWLFDELIKRVGINDAQEAFLHVIDEESDITKDHDKRILLFRLALTRDKNGKRKENVQQLAAAVRVENEAFNKALPPERKSEVRQTNQSSIEKYIRRLRDAKAAQGQSPQPRRKKKTARKIAYAGKPRLGKPKSAHR